MKRPSVLAVVFLFGCAASTHAERFDASSDDDASVSSRDAGVDASQGGNDASHEASDDAASSGVALPFNVSDEFVPSGYMGDSQASMSAIAMKNDATACKTPRMSGAGGDCYSIAWTAAIPDGGAAWAGVYWQSPSMNWGEKPGKGIAPGATKVSFYAAGAVGGETIQVCAGGIGTATSTYKDSFSAKSPPITLTTSWTRYELPLAGASYTGVLGAFCWVAAASAPTTMTFYVDDLRWE